MKARRATLALALALALAGCGTAHNTAQPPPPSALSYDEGLLTVELASGLSKIYPQGQASDAAWCLALSIYPVPGSDFRPPLGNLRGSAGVIDQACLTVLGQ